MTTEEAVLHLRTLPEFEERIRTSYLDADIRGSAERFACSEEFRQVLGLLGKRVRGATVLDIGAGRGIASYALARAGAARVYAVEPDGSTHIGRGAIALLRNGLPINIVDGVCENLPFPEMSVDIVYGRQVLHHTKDLRRGLRECARVLRPGGIFLACREHVVENDGELKEFLSDHPIHQLAGGENAYRLAEYREAIAGAELSLQRVLGPLGSVINAFPQFSSDAELKRHIRWIVARRFGRLGMLATYVPGVVGVARSALEGLARSSYNAPPGKMYTFLARKEPVH